MFSDLALVDWLALGIAVLLLCVAAIAALLARSAGRRETPEQHRPVSNRYVPSHASSGRVEGSLGIHLVNHDPSPPKPGHAVIPGLSPSSPAHAAREEAGPLRKAKPGKHAAFGLQPPVTAAHADTEGQSAHKSPISEAPPMFMRSSPPAHLEITELETEIEAETLDLTDTLDLRDNSHAEKLAERAARLRGRPVSEPESRRPESETATLDRFKKREPGFFADPIGRHELRYWNGSSWTEYAKEGADRVIDPI